MIKIKDIASFKEAVNTFNPKFEMVENIDECADKINLPHEDYPDFVSPTKESISYLINEHTEFGMNEIKEYDIKAIHTLCMNKKKYIKKGMYRTFEVGIENTKLFCEPFLIGSLMEKILPISMIGITNDELIEWYRKFETIHPFEDGNGRVGGIIVATLSFLNHGKYLTPKR